MGSSVSNGDLVAGKNETSSKTKSTVLRLGLKRICCVSVENLNLPILTIGCGTRD
jgi:hypothetical protein